MKNLYEILEVSCNASHEEIKKSYRTLSKKYHPDLNQGNKVAEEKFKEVNEAYAVLSHAERRKEYDQKQNATVNEQTETKKQEAQTKKATDFARGSFDINNISQQFEQYFGFDPQGIRKSERLGGNQRGAKNPLDTSSIFEGFFRPKKK